MPITTLCFTKITTPSTRGFQSLFVCLVLTLLCACDSGEKPDASWEVASVSLYSAALSNDGAQAVVGSVNHGGSLWAVSSNKRLFNWNHKQGEYTAIIASAFSPDGQFALTADHQTLVLWNAKSGEAITYWTAPSEILSVALTANGNYALLGLSNYNAVLFNVKRGGVERTFPHTDRVRSVALSDNGHIAITGSEDQTAKLWDVNSGENLATWKHGDEVVTVAISGDGSKALSVAQYDRAVLWDTKSRTAIGDLPLQGSAVKRGKVFSAARFSNDNRYLISGNTAREVQLWNAATLKPINKWTIPRRDLLSPTSASILAVGFSGNDKTFFAVSSNGFIHRLRR